VPNTAVEVQQPLPFDQGGHAYPDDRPAYCRARCGCVVGLSRPIEQPAGVDAFGKCPRNPINTAPLYCTDRFDAPPTPLSMLLCRETGAEAIQGDCPVHTGDFCLEWIEMSSTPTIPDPPPAHVTVHPDCQVTEGVKADVSPEPPIPTDRMRRQDHLAFLRRRIVADRNMVARLEKELSG
jgi:hypothetical protein